MQYIYGQEVEKSLFLHRIMARQLYWIRSFFHRHHLIWCQIAEEDLSKAKGGKLILLQTKYYKPGSSESLWLSGP